jgi:hypothetical protein
VTRIDPSSQPLSLTPLFWILLALVAALGVACWLGNGDEVTMLGYLEDEQLVIIRANAAEHTFPSLGIKIAPPEGWTYLSLTDDAIADRPTFMNESTHCIISIRRFQLRSWPPTDGQPITQRYGDFDIQWMEVDHRCIGRLSKAEIDLAILVMTHKRGSLRDKSIDEFCQSIRLLDAS